MSKKIDKIKVDFDKRDKIQKILGADHVSLCYQCGACVGDCPTARFYPEFNPRTIMLKTLVGDIDDLTGKDSIIWLCSNCYNCYERCPQDVRPVEVIIALKNLATQNGNEPEQITDVSKHVLETGRSVPVMDSLDRMRANLGLKPLEKIDVSELQKIVEPDEEDNDK